jgi:GntR family transcriptional regulator
MAQAQPSARTRGRSLGSYVAHGLGSADDSAEPKHKLLFNVLARAIAEGVIAQGELLPNETALTALTPYSLGTVQKALGSLVEHGYVERKRAVGTVVRRWRQEMDQPWHCRFAIEDGQWLPVYPHVLKRAKARGDGEWRKVLVDAREPIHIDRRIDIGDAFRVFSRFYVDAARYPVFLSQPIENLEAANFKRIMPGLDVPLTRIKQALRMAPVAAGIARIVGLQAGDLALHVKACGQSGKGDALYYQELVIPPSDYDLWIDSRLEPLLGL